MFLHTIKLAFRSYRRNKSTFFINLIGLSTGLACVLLIYLWVNDEMSMDKFHEKDSQLYQVRQNFALPNGVQAWVRTPGLLAEALMTELPEVEVATTTSNHFFQPNGVISFEGNFLELSGMFADEHFFDLFSYPLLQGEHKELLVDKNNIVLSETTAENLFGTPADALGQIVSWQNRFFEQSFEVTGVFETPPANATKQFDAIIHYDLLIDWDHYAGNWNGDYAETFVMLKPETDIQALNEKIAPFLRSRGEGREPSTLFTQQFSKQYLHGTYENGVQVGGRIAYVRLFSIIALFILFIACINFMNLSTAQASKKMKEIGVKKTIGAKRKHLIIQFLGESMFLATGSFILAMLIVFLLLPQFNMITGKTLHLTLDVGLISTFIGIALVTGLIAGSYPAFYLSGFKPIKVLKGERSSSTSEKWIRKSLVVFQFALSIVFIVGVLLINQQMEYTQVKNLGYNKNNILTFQVPPQENDPQLFLSELKNIAGVKNVGNMHSTVVDKFDGASGYSWSGQEKENQILFDAPRIGYDVIETLGIKVLEGRSFSRNMKDDYTKILINESALKMMNLEEPIGKKLGRASWEKEVIGVIKDFQYGSIHHKIEPLILRFRSDGRDILVNFQAGAENTTIPKIEQTFKKFHPNYTFNYSFLDEEYQNLYQAEGRVAVLSKYFSILAIIISCLGLLGLTVFTAERREKEIGIRKVLGASIAGIVGLLSKDFLKLVIIAFIIATPIAYYCMNQWLDNFAYRINIQWWVFALAGISAIGIAFLIVSFQSIKAALANPVESLRNE